VQGDNDIEQTIDVKTPNKYIRKSKVRSLNLYELILSKATVATEPANDARFTFDIL
jgi:hypothetical protein